MGLGRRDSVSSRSDLEGRENSQRRALGAAGINFLDPKQLLLGYNSATRLHLCKNIMRTRQEQ